MNEEIRVAAQALLNDDVVVLPTETVYGLAAAISSESAVRSVFEIKGRPLLDPLIVHVLDDSWIERCADCDGLEAKVKSLTEAFWPGPLTIVLPKRPEVSKLITGGLDTIALRSPAHDIFREVLREVDIPLAAPSANPFGYLSPTTFQHVRETLGSKVKVIIDGGKCTVGLESTILNITDNIPCILRPGAISANEIANVLDTVVLDYNPTKNNISVPGQSLQHYSPHTKLCLFGTTESLFTVIDNNTENRAAFICLKRPESIPNNDVFWLSENGDYNVIANSLFDILQTLDHSNYDVIYCQRVENIGIGIAINDRLSRAAAKFNN